MKKEYTDEQDDDDEQEEKERIIKISAKPIPLETKAEKRILNFFLGIFVNLDTNRISLTMALNLCTLLIITILRFQM